MPTFQVHANGTIFGAYKAASEQEARDLCAQDAGYKDEADMVKQLERPSDLVADFMSSHPRNFRSGRRTSDVD